MSVVFTEPTASLTRRAALLCEAVSGLLDRAPRPGEPHRPLQRRPGRPPALHPRGRPCPRGADPERCAAPSGRVVTVSTPHHGTPLAQGFSGLLGQQLLRLLSLTTIHALRTGRLPISAVLRLAHVLRNGARPSGVLDQLYQQLLADFSGERRRTVEAFLADVRSDQGLVGQLKPAGMEIFNASAQDRPGLPYGSVVTRARPPGLRSLLGAGLDPSAQATHALFVALYRMSASGPQGVACRPSTASTPAVLRRAYGRIPDAGRQRRHRPHPLADPRGIARGRLGRPPRHPGPLRRPTHVPPHFDWMSSGTGFDQAGFEQAWRRVAIFIAGV